MALADTPSKTIGELIDDVERIPFAIFRIRCLSRQTVLHLARLLFDGSGQLSVISAQKRESSSDD